jgi:hypothetical protein
MKGNKNKYKENHAKWRQENKQRISEKSNEYYLKNKDLLMQRYYDNKEEILKKRAKHYVENKERLLAKHREYYRQNEDAIKEQIHTYSASPRGREVDRLKRFRRKDFGMKPIDKPFDGSAFHHMHLEINGQIDKAIGIYIPYDLHVSIFHNNYTGQGMREINKAALLWLCEQSIIVRDKL